MNSGRVARAIDSNLQFVKYYNEVNPLFSSSSGSSWSEFSVLMETPLPTTFWINDTDARAATFIEELKAAGAVDSDAPVIEPIEWYPVEDCGWRVAGTLDKHEFRKSARSQPLRQLMIQLTALGVISRQEEVSMIPPLLLDVKKDEKCLDMCAAPGSKTAQLLVALGRDLQQQQQQKSSVSSSSGENVTLPLPFDYLENTKGFIVANELDEKRSNMLVHQCKRIQQLFPFAIFTNHDARSMPSLIINNTATSNDCGGNDEYFDKILCDVMCSGDGILRKAPKTVLRDWKPFDAALFLQASQIQVALRGVHLLKVGGRLVYSTCSMNPVENEAVVCQIILQSHGAMQLVDARSKLLPNLKCDPGMKKWKVMLNDSTVLENFSEAEKWKSSLQREQQHRFSESIKALTPSLFPPSEAEAATIPLEYCLRLLPHHCNGGGFFVAVFEKTAPSHPHQQQQTDEKEIESKKEVNNINNNNIDDDEPTANYQSKEERKTLEALTTVPYLPFLPVPQKVRSDIFEEYSIAPGSFDLINNLVFRAPTAHQLDQRRERQQKLQQQQQQQNQGMEENNFQDDDEKKNDDIMKEEKDISSSTTTTIEMSNNGSVHVVSSSVFDVIIRKRNPSLRICAAGLRCFAPGVGLGKWKVANEASRIVATGLYNSNSPRILKISSTQLIQHVVLPMVFSDSPLKDISIEEDLLQSPIEEVRTQVGLVLKNLAVGCVMLQIDLAKLPQEANGTMMKKHDGDGEGNVNNFLWVPCLRARSRLQLLTDLEDTEGLKCRLGFKPSQNPSNKTKN